MTIVYIAVTGVISGMVIYTLKRLKDYRYPERSPLYTLLIHTPHEITRIYEVIHASISAGDRASWGTDTPLSRENTTQSDTQRIGFIDDMKKNGVKVMHSIFYFHYHSTRSPLTLTIPTHEAPYFASMIEKKVPKAKLGYNENYTKNRQNIRKKLSILFLCLFGIVLAGCEKQIAQPIDSDIDYEMGAWFVGDNKYIDEQGDSDTIDTWRKHKLTSIETKGINNDTSNILDGNGPGPNGAQRNGDAPIIVAVLIPMREKDIQKIQISINDNEQPTSLLNALATSGQQTIIYWTMNDREKNLRPIKKDDMITLYGSEKVQAFESDPSSFLTPLNTGEIYTITAHIDTKDGEHTITKVFHIVYGE